MRSERPFGMMMADIGHFQIEQCVGTGGMGVVHRAAWGGLGPSIPVAVKFITRGSSDDRDPAFLREARMAARLSHPNVVTLLDVGRTGEPVVLGEQTIQPDTPYLVMEWVDGPTVKGAAPQSWDDLAHVLDGLLAALAHAHAWSVLHRDIKPGNVMLTTDGVVKLTDFGIGRAMEREDGTRPDSGRVLGTPHYMAPEQIIGSWRDEGPWTDLYGAGILAWRLATGAAPFTGTRKVVLAQQIREEPREFSPQFDVPASFEEWLRRLLQKRPEDRFRRAADARAALLALSEPPSKKRRTRRYLESLDATGESAADVEPAVPERWPSDDRALARDLRPAGLGLFGLRRAPIVGREREKGRLWDALRQVCDERRARTVVVRGSAGVGKTALAGWLARRAIEGGYADVLRSFWESEPVPGDGVEGALERFFDIEELPRQEAINRVRQKLIEIGFQDDTTELAAMLTERLTRAERTSRGLTSRDEWFHVVKELLVAISADRPVIWLLDDAQWSNAAVDFVRRMNGRDLPVLFVATIMESVDAERPPGFEGHLESIVERSETDLVDVGPLSGDAQRELVNNLLRLDPALVEEVVHRTDGSPLFAAQLIGDWVMRDMLEPGPVGYGASSERIDELPEDIHEMWQRRLAMACSAREDYPDALGLAAVLGQEVDLDEWLAALEAAGLSTEGDLVERLVVHGLATWHYGGFAFVHRMLRESVLTACEDLPRLNLAVAEALRSFGRRDGRTLERIARHLARAGEDGAAFDNLVAAIEQYYQAEDIDTVILLGGVLDTWARNAGAETSLRYANALCRLGAVYRYRAELDLARKLLSRAVEIALAGDTPEELIEEPDPPRNELVARVASELAILGEETIPDQEVTLRFATLARDVGGAADLALEEAWGAAMQASTWSETGEPDRALEAARFAVRRLEDAELTHGRHGMHTYFTLSEVAKLAGELDESERALERGLEVARAIGQRIGVAYGLSRRSDHFFTIGKLDAAREAATMAHELYRRTGSPTADYISANILLYDLEEGRFGGTLERARQLLQRWQNYGMGRRLPTLHLSVAVCQAHEGADDEARKHWDVAVATANSTGRVVDDAVILSVLLATHSEDPELTAEAVQFADEHRALLPARYEDQLDRLRSG